MKAILKFNLPEDREEYLRAVKAMDLCKVLYEFDNHLRNEIKHNGKDYQELRDKLYQLMGVNNVDLEELYQ